MNPLLLDHGGSRWMWCPGCNDVHRVDDKWTWNGSTTAPTITPSILVTLDYAVRPDLNRRCHSFLTDGVWQFLGDCSHAMAGQSVPMVPVPDWMVAEPTARAGG